MSIAPKRDFLWLGCHDGHDWRSIGGANAGCDDVCRCSVPVHQCARCGDCDYGENEEATEVRRECAEMRCDPLP